MDIFFTGLLFICGLCWGSFLNVLAYRLVHRKKLWTARSRCPSCNNVIRWYDNIPLFSWIVLSGRCRFCKASISFLYPFTEFVTAVLVTALFYKVVPPVGHFFSMMIIASDYWILARSYKMFGVYLIFLSALIAATRTDLEKMVIPQLFSLWLVPVGVIASYVGFLQVSFTESILGSLLGYGVLWLVAFFFKRIMGKEGMGVGDMELLAMIGSFLGPFGVWFALMIGSLSGVVIGALYLFFAGKGRESRIPFGPFLAFGAIIFFFFDRFFIEFFLGI